MKVTKIRQKSVLILALTLLVGGLAPFLAQPSAKADDVVQGYSAKTALEPGLVVTLDQSATRTVKPAEADKPGEIFGIVVDPSDAPITLVGSQSKVFVATSGTFPVLVSLTNGSIKAGDYIAMSNVNGVAAKATNAEPLVVGKAASAFDDKGKAVTTVNGKAIGRVLVDIGVGKNPLATLDPTVPAFLKKIANSVANKPVPVIRVYSALMVFIISVLAAVTILWSGVRSSLISLGRNPLSKHSIFMGMYKVVFTGLGVFIIGVAGVYLLLKI